MGKKEKNAVAAGVIRGKAGEPYSRANALSY